MLKPLGLWTAETLLLAVVACSSPQVTEACTGGVDCEPRSLDGFPITPPVVPDGAAYDISIETPSLEDVLEKGYLTTEQSPVHIAARAVAGTGTSRCEWRGIARTTEQREDAIRFWLGIDDDAPLPSVEEVEQLFMPYVNDMEPRFRFAWKANVSAMVNGGLNTSYVFLTCYADYTVNEYLLGAGTDTLAIAYDTGIRMQSYALYERAHAAGAVGGEDKLTAAEYEARLQGIVSAAESSFGTALEGRESIVFIAPMGAHGNVATEVWQAAAQWDLQAEEDGTVNAVRYGVPEGDAEHTQTLANLKTRVTTAAANDEFAGKRIANVSGLTQHYRDIGAYEDITPGDGETTTFTPMQPPPPLKCASGKAVTDPNAKRSLVHDCEALLAAKDTLAGTASLNWSVDLPITRWDGVTTARTPLRVVRLELPDKSLSGSVPAELGRLSGLTRLDLSANSLTGALPEELELLSDLAFIRLAGNSFTGCVPYALRNVADSDLGSVGIPYCAGMGG